MQCVQKGFGHLGWEPGPTSAPRHLDSETIYGHPCNYGVNLTFDGFNSEGLEMHQLAAEGKLLSRLRGVEWLHLRLTFRDAV